MGRLCLRRAAPAFEILMLAPVRRFFPEPRQRLNGGWRRARALHPSEDLSELSPLLEAVAGQEYHCPRTRSLRGSLPKLLLDGWVPLVTFLGRLYAGTFLPHRWSSRILRIAVPFLAHPLDVIQSLDMYFSSCTRRTENVPSLLVGIKSKVLIGSFQKLFNFFQNSVLSLAYRGLFDVHNLRDLTLCFSVLISQCQQELLVGR